MFNDEWSRTVCLVDLVYLVYLVEGEVAEDGLSCWPELRNNSGNLRLERPDRPDEPDRPEKPTQFFRSLLVCGPAGERAKYIFSVLLPRRRGLREVAIRPQQLR
jgi:hypothetical protein